LLLFVRMTPREIRLKAFAGLSNLLLILGAVFFIGAGTFRFWQAWIYLLLFGGSSLLITLFLMKKDMELLQRRLRAGPGGEKEKKQKVIQVFASLSFIVLMLYPALDQRFHLSAVPLSLTLVGDLLVIVGFYIVFLVFKENTYTSAVIETDVHQTVVTTGPYAKVRHPMYSGALLMLLFTPMALGSYGAVVFFFPIALVIVIRLLDEEKFLSRNLAGYREYCHRVRYRLIPGIW
jgi:protein-S-isoprenylcysteine O-methyltransferase Ste14